MSIAFLGAKITVLFVESIYKETKVNKRKGTQPMKSNDSSKSSNDSSNSSKRMTVVLPSDTARMLDILSSLQSITLNEAIRRAISTESYIQSEISNNSKILVEGKDGQVRELIFR